MRHTMRRSHHESFEGYGRPGPPLEEAKSLFVYGSLLFPEVLEAILGRVPDSRQAATWGWRVARLNNRSYPVLTPNDGIAHGRVLTDLSYEEWRTIDEFEDSAYELRPIGLVDGSSALAYLCRESPATVLPNWSIEEFKASELSDYVSMCRKWRRDRRVSGSQGRLHR